MYAVITAGGTSSDALARATGSAYKALAPLGRGCLIDPAIAAARGIGAAGIAVVAPPEVAAYCAGRVDRVVEASAAGTENIVRALQAFPAADRLVFLTCDMPFIDAPALAAFVERSSDAALTMALGSAAAYRAEFPGAPPHTVKLGADEVANGSAFVIARAAIAPLERVAGRFFSARKSLPRLAALLGPVLCVRFALRRLRMTDIEARATRVLGVPARAVTDAAPGLCFDVDDVADWAYAHSLAEAYG